MVQAITRNNWSGNLSNGKRRKSVCQGMTRYCRGLRKVNDSRQGQSRGLTNRVKAVENFQIGWSKREIGPSFTGREDRGSILGSTKVMVRRRLTNVVWRSNTNASDR